MALPPSAGPFKLRVLTFNVWAVPFVGVSTNERIDALMASLVAEEEASGGRGSYDVVGFQEVFTPYAINKLRECLPRAGLPFLMHYVGGADMPQGADGSGCVIASRFEILDTAWHPFSCGGRPYQILEWDWHASKGIGMARLRLPGEYGTADVYVSHLQAQYHDAPRDFYAHQRVLQAVEAAIFVRTTRRSDLTLLLGDLNSGPDTLVYRVLTTLAGFKDAYSCTHTREDALLHGGTLTASRARAGFCQPSSSLPAATAAAPVSSPTLVRSIYDSTFGGAENTFSYLFARKAKRNSGVYSAQHPPPPQQMGPPPGMVPGHRAADGKTKGWLPSLSSGPPACDVNVRLDYILFGTGSITWPFTVAPFSVSLLHRTWHVTQSDIRLKKYITLKDGREVNLSDHSAVYAELACVILAPTLHVRDADDGSAALPSSASRTGWEQPLQGSVAQPGASTGAAPRARRRGSSAASELASSLDSSLAAAGLGPVPDRALSLQPWALHVKKGGLASSVSLTDLQRAGADTRCIVGDESIALHLHAAAEDTFSALTDLAGTDARLRSGSLHDCNPSSEPSASSTRARRSLSTPPIPASLPTSFGSDGSAPVGKRSDRLVWRTSSRSSVRAAESMLREALAAAGVPLDRCAALPAEMQQAQLPADRSHASKRQRGASLVDMDSSSQIQTSLPGIDLPGEPAASVPPAGIAPATLSPPVKNCGSPTPKLGHSPYTLACDLTRPRSASYGPSSSTHVDGGSPEIGTHAADPVSSQLPVSRVATMPLLALSQWDSASAAAIRPLLEAAAATNKHRLSLIDGDAELLHDKTSAEKPAASANPGHDSESGLAPSSVRRRKRSPLRHRIGGADTAPSESLADDTAVLEPSRSQWDTVLLEAQESLQLGVAQQQQRHWHQVLRSNAVICLGGALMYSAMLLQWHADFSRGSDAFAWGALQTAVVCVGLTWVYTVALRATTLGVALAGVVSLALAGVGLMLLALLRVGVAALIFGLGVGMLPLGTVMYFIAAFLTSKEARDYTRLEAQVRILMHRPPAVVA